MRSLLVSHMIAAHFLVTFTSTSDAATFTGAWFQVWYPDQFQVIPSMPSSSSHNGVDSAFFRSPDGQVEFYIFSPQWSGDPSDIALDPIHETLRAKETKPSGDGQMTWLTIDANDHSYSRSYQYTISGADNTTAVIGIKYSNQTAFNRYKSSYRKFKESFEQYAD